jgi:hypothetical protein
MTVNNQQRFGLVSLILLSGVCAFLLMYWITDKGPGVSPDSTAYIESAQNLLAGNGLFIQGEPMIHYPPGYPLMIAVADMLHPGNILQAARLLAALLFSANLVLFGFAAYRSTGNGLAATACAMLVFLVSEPLISAHSMAWSEAPFITFTIASILLLSRHIERPNPYLLVLASFMAGYAAATRYVGVVAFPPMALALFLLGNRRLRFKLRDAMIFVGIASLPLMCWSIRNIFMTGSVADRNFAFHPIGWGKVASLIVTVHDFILPVSISGWMKALHVGVVAALFVLGFAVYTKTQRKQAASSSGIVLPSVCIMYSFIYLMFVVVSVSFFDALTYFDNRILLPIYLALTIAAISLAWSLSEALTRRQIWYGFLLLVLLSSSIKAKHAISTAIEIRRNGSGYTSRYWRNSDIIAYLSDVSEAITIYSNGPDAIRFLTGKKAAMLPSKVFVDDERNEDYQDQLNQIIRKCKAGNALIVHLNAITGRWYFPSNQEIEATDDIPVLSRSQEGVIYGVSTVHYRSS